MIGPIRREGSVGCYERRDPWHVRARTGRRNRLGPLRENPKTARDGNRYSLKIPPCRLGGAGQGLGVPVARPFAFASIPPAV
jgi:hypothetical protein